MSSLKSANVESSNGRALNWVQGVGAFALLFAVVAVVAVGPNALPWCLALFAPGALTGFLFAVPRVRPAGNKQGPTNDDSSESPRHVINTNLEEISDWVTKTLVGLGLVELKNLPPSIDRLAARIAASLGSPGAVGVSVGLAIAVGSPTIGFFFGYIATRLMLQRDIVQSDRSVADLEQRLTSITVVQDVLSTAMEESAPAAGSSTRAFPPGQAPVDDELRKLAQDYLDVRIEDDRQRLAKKNDLVNRMVVHIAKAGISRAALAAEAPASEGLLIALAGMIHVSPALGDADVLLSVANGAKLKHVRYRVVLALGALFERKMTRAADRSRVLKLLSSYEVEADDPLLKAIGAVRRVVENSG